MNILITEFLFTDVKAFFSSEESKKNLSDVSTSNPIAHIKFSLFTFAFCLPKSQACHIRSSLSLHLQFNRYIRCKCKLIDPPVRKYIVIENISLVI